MVHGLRSPTRTYLLALAGVLVAVLARQLLDPWLGEHVPFVTLYGAVAFAVWVGGVRPALLAMVVGAVGSEYLFVEPRGTLQLDTPKHLIGLLAYLASSSIIVYFGWATREAQAEAQRRLQYLKTTVGCIGDAVIATDSKGRVQWLNAAAEQLTGWPPAEAVGRPLAAVFRIVDEQTRLPVENPAARALREGVVTGLANPALLLDRKGSERPIDDSAAPIRDESGNVSGCILVFRDVTERRRSEAERLANARLLASIVESSEDAIVSKSRQGIIQTWNAAAERLFGHKAEEAVGRHITLLLPEDRADEEGRIMRRILEGQRVEAFDSVRVHKDGHLIDVALTISPLMDEAGVVVGASKIARDISPQKDAEKRIYGLMAALEESARRKDQFLATLAHELRGPLAPIRNSLEILKRAPRDSSTLEDARAALDRQVAQVEWLVDDLLDLSRITHNRLELRRLPVDLGSAIDQAIEPTSHERGTGARSRAPGSEGPRAVTTASPARGG